MTAEIHKFAYLTYLCNSNQKLVVYPQVIVVVDFSMILVSLAYVNIVTVNM